MKIEKMIEKSHLSRKVTLETVHFAEKSSVSEFRVRSLGKIRQKFGGVALRKIIFGPKFDDVCLLHQKSPTEIDKNREKTAVFNFEERVTFLSKGQTILSGGLLKSSPTFSRSLPRREK